MSVQWKIIDLYPESGGGKAIASYYRVAVLQYWGSRNLGGGKPKKKKSELCWFVGSLELWGLKGGRGTTRK